MSKKIHRNFTSQSLLTEAHAVPGAVPGAEVNKTNSTASVVLML